MVQVGMLSSALEHSVPEQMLTDPNSTTKPEGFSTAKALGMAMAQGQKIYTINQQNQAQALQNLRLDSGAMDEIRSSLAAGKEIIAHTDQLTVSGYKGSGYAILDSATGEGIYKISGGKNGGFSEGGEDRDVIDFLFALVSNLPENASTAIAGVLAAIKGYLLFDGCDSASSGIVVGSYVVIATLLTSFILGAIFATFSIGLGPFAAIGLALFLSSIGMIIGYLLDSLIEVAENSPVCKRNE